MHHTYSSITTTHCILAYAAPLISFHLTELHITRLSPQLCLSQRVAIRVGDGDGSVVTAQRQQVLCTPCSTCDAFGVFANDGDFPFREEKSLYEKNISFVIIILVYIYLDHEMIKFITIFIVHNVNKHKVNNKQTLMSCGHKWVNSLWLYPLLAGLPPWTTSGMSLDLWN